MEEGNPAMISAARRTIPVYGRTGNWRNHFGHGLYIQKGGIRHTGCRRKSKKQKKAFCFMKNYCLHVVMAHPDGMLSQ